MTFERNSKIKPVTLPGFTELLPNEQIAFNKMVNTIQQSFELFGFNPMDTPIIEKAEILMAKGGEESEKQTYVFKKGDTDMALRFDLTVPLARFVSEHINELIFPFKRYQIGKVYRGEKPQKGRSREFYQCDIDIVGRGKLDIISDAEIFQAIYHTFEQLNIGKFVIKINNRKLLSGFLTSLNIEDAEIANTLHLIDKLDKMDMDKFVGILKEQGWDPTTVARLVTFLELSDANMAQSTLLSKLAEQNVINPLFQQGLSELQQVTKYINDFGIPQSEWKIDLKIVRGLDYYTGTVYETFLVDQPQIGSVCSGGRYDNLAEYYTDQKLPGVGISLGLTRLFYQLNELNLIDKKSHTTAKVLVISMENLLSKALQIATELRTQNIPTEVYTDETTAFRKKLEYANKLAVPFVVIIGENEARDNTVTIKNMETGEQKTVDGKRAGEYLQKAQNPR
jgi:histidyl-tRNA synthetase